MYRVHLNESGLDADSVGQYRTSCLKRRLTKHFGSRVFFVSHFGHMSDLICSASLSTSDLLKAWTLLKTDENYIRIEDPNSEGENSDDEYAQEFTKMSIRVAHNIKADLKDIESKIKEDASTSWNTTYDQALTTVPVSLYNILAHLLSTNPNIDRTDDDGRVILDDSPNDENASGHLSTHEKILNIAQDIVFSASGIRTPQHVSLATYVYHKTRSKDLITILNRIGLCISYTDLQRILTSVACQITDETEEDNIFIPANILPGMFTQFAIDNLDFSECTLDGSSMHVTSMVMYQSPVEGVVQGGSIGTVPSRLVRRTSPVGCAGDMDMKYVAKLRKLKRNMHSGKNTEMDWLLEQKDRELPNLDLCWVLSRLYHSFPPLCV